MAAVHRGVLFEVCYSQLVANSDARARGTFIANMLELVRATKGRGIVLSSEARATAGGVGLRAPADVMNLFACWGLGNEKGTEALGVHPRAVVVNEGLKRRGYRGVVDIIQAEGRIPASQEKEDGDDGEKGKEDARKKKSSGGGTQQKPKNKVGQKQSSGQQDSGIANGKRKHDGGSDHGGGDQASLPVLSKRQAKKLKLAEQKATDGPVAANVK